FRSVDRNPVMDRFRFSADFSLTPNPSFFKRAAAFCSYIVAINKVSPASARGFDALPAAALDGRAHSCYHQDRKQEGYRMRRARQDERAALAALMFDQFYEKEELQQQFSGVAEQTAR